MNPYITNSLLPFIVSAGVATLVLVYFTPVAREIGLVDHPTERKRHEQDIPLIGGIGIVLSFYLSLLLAPFGLGEFRYILFGMGILFIIGVLDDHQDISAGIKFGVQVLAASIFVAGGTVVTGIGDIFNWADGNLQGLGQLSTVLTVVAIVGLVNAFNFIDGHDGLSGSMLLVTMLVIAYLCGINEIWKNQYIVLLFLTSVLVFLVFNWPGLVSQRRQVFLGDAGSMMLGMILAYMLIDLSERPVPVLKSTSAPWLVGLPLIDMISVIVFRLTQKQSITKPDRRHIHHLLVDLGFSKTQNLITLVGVHCLFVGVGLVGTIFQIPDWVLFWSMFPMAIVYCFICRRLAYKIKSRVPISR